MSNQVPAHFVKAFNSNVAHIAQQKKTIFGDCARMETLSGEEEYFDQIGTTTPVERVGRHADTPYMETPHLRRKVFGKTYDWADLVDKPDKLKMLYDPQSPYARNAGYAFARLKDDILLAALYADAYTGKDGTTTIAWSSMTGQVVARNFGGSNVGLTVEKLVEAKRIILAADVDPDEEIYMGISPLQLADLLNNTKVQSMDYNSVKALVEGKVDTFMGFKFKVSNRILKDASNVWRCPVWAKSGLLLAMASEVTTRIDELPTKNYTTQVFASMTMGACRMEEVKVVEVLCLA